MAGSIVTNLLTLTAVLVGVGGLLAVGVVWLMARALLRPPRMTDGKAAWALKRLSPGDLELAFEDVTFDVRDERDGAGGGGGTLRIAAWWIPAAESSGRTVVLLHGYADAKVGAIAWAPLWHDLGFNALAIDLRAHGDSGGDESTAGYFERHDVAQVIGRLRAERPGQTRHVVLFGVSLGASVAVATAADDGTAGTISALVLESPFADFRTAAMVHMNALAAPGAVFQRAALRLAEWTSGARFDDVRLPDGLRRVTCPVLIVAPSDDGFSTSSEAADMEAALAARPPGAGVGRAWNVAGGQHLTAVQENPESYRQKLSAFLQEALGTSQISPGPAAARAPSNAGR